MIRHTALPGLLSATALGFVALAPQAAQAQCVTGGDTTICTGPGNTAIVDGTDGQTFVIDPGAAIGPLLGRAMTLSGADQTVVNDGLIESTDDEAIRSEGPRLVIENYGTIRAAADRGIRLRAGADEAYIYNGPTGLIFAQDRGIGADNDANLAGVVIENEGIIESLDGRAIQSRGPGTAVFNTGILIGGEEVIEARTGFFLENTGTIMIRDGVADEDGVQFASGVVFNEGLIQGSDDGIDVDEGIIFNGKTGVIRSLPAPGEPGGNGIDADAELQDPVNGDGPADLLLVFNEGLVEGPKAIGVDEARTAAIGVANGGTLRGTGGVAVEFNPGMDASLLELFDHSMIFGDVLMTDGDDLVIIGPLASGMLSDGIFDGRGGIDLVEFDGYALSDLRVQSAGNQVRLILDTDGGPARGTFDNFEEWSVGGVTYSSAELAALAPIPLPAGLPLLTAGLAGLWALRRRGA